MSKHLLSVGLALVVLTTFTSVAQADAYVELVPTPLGPYFGGENVHVEVWISSDTGEDDDYVRLFQLAFHATDPSLGVTGFAFDFRSLLDDGSAYTIFEDLPLPQAACFSPNPIPGYMWNLPADGSSICMARFDVALPPAVGEEPLMLDVMNFGAGHGDETARIYGGFPLDLEDLPLLHSILMGAVVYDRVHVLHSRPGIP